jgi:NADPH2:quinone reductase
MKAVRFTHFGGPDVLTIDDLPDLVPAEGQARVRIEAASINPSDLKNIEGVMKQTTLPRTPGRDYAGVVDAGPSEWIGVEVWGSGNGGIAVDGTHAQQIIVPVTSLRRKPGKLDFDQAAAVGVNYLAAWRGLVDFAGLQAGETVAIIGAGGGVGGAAALIARRIGARVIGVDRARPPDGAAILDVAATTLFGEADTARAVRDASGGRGADVVFDAVGGVMFRTALSCLALRGRLVEISATGQRDVTFDLADFYHNESRLFGVDTLKLDFVAAAGVLESVRPGFDDGAFRSAPIARTFPIDEAVAAYRAVAEGERGRVVLRPQPASPQA